MYYFLYKKKKLKQKMCEVVSRVPNIQKRALAWEKLKQPNRMA